MKRFAVKQSYCGVIVGLVFAGYFQASAAREIDTVRVTIHPLQQYYIGDTSTLDRTKFFNLHSSPADPDAAEMDLLFIKHELNAGYGRVFWGPMAVSETSNYPSTEQAIIDGAKAIENAKNVTYKAFNSNRVVVTEHPASVINEGNDPVEGARWAADYFEYFFDDESRPVFYEPMNEPFVHAGDFVEGPWDPVANAEVQYRMATWFGEIGKAFDQRGLDTQVIGFSSAWPSYELNDFSHWASRQKMFMDVAGEHMDAFSFHLYDGVNVTGQDNFRSGSNAEAIIDMIEAYSFIKWGKVKDHAVTEYGGIVEGYPLEYSPEKSSQELRSYNHILFSLLEREDRILTSVPFITGISKWFYDANNFNPYSAAVLRPDPDKIVGSKVKGYLPTEKAKFYLLWADVKGNRVVVEEKDPDLAVQAFSYGDKLYVALNNYEDSSKPVSLNFVSFDQGIQQVRAKRLYVPYDGAANYTDEVLAQVPSSIMMAAHETVVLEYTLASTVSPESIVRSSSYYTDIYLQPIVQDTVMSFPFNDVALPDDEAQFVDVLSESFIFDQAIYDSINDNEVVRLQALLRSYERQLASIKRRQPDNWQESRALTRLLDRAARSKNTAKALHYHFAQNGYNTSPGMAMIKLGIGRKHDKSKQPQMRINGHSVSVPNDWRGADQATRDDFFGVIEIPVPAKFLKTDNIVDFVFPDTQGHISSVILTVDTEESYQGTPVSGIELPLDIAIKKDRPYRLQANILPADATNKYVVWTSSDPAVATVEDGVITPVSPGYVNIIGRTFDGDFEATTQVHVKDEVTLRNTIVITNDVSTMESASSITLDIDYSTDIERDVAFELIGPDGKWLGLSRLTVPAGEGTTQITLSFDDILPAGKGYKIIAALRQVGGDWRTSVDGHTISGVEITSGETPPNPTNNLLGDNGGFERGDLGDWNYVFGSSGQAVVTADAAMNGDYGILFDTTDGRVGITLDESVLPEGLMKAGKAFTLSFYLKRLSTGPWSGGMSQFINTNGGWKTSGQKWFGGTQTGTWERVEIQIDGVNWPDTQTSFEVNLMTQGHTWYADDFVLEEVTTP